MFCAYKHCRRMNLQVISAQAARSYGRLARYQACATHFACLKTPGERRARIPRFICAPAGVRPTVIADAKPV